MGLASRMLRIRTGEGRLVASLVGLMFVSMAAIVIGESAIDASVLRPHRHGRPPPDVPPAGSRDVRRDARPHVGAGQDRRTARVRARTAHARRDRAGRAHRAHHRRPVDLPGPVGHGRHRDAHPGRLPVGHGRGRGRHPAGQAAVPDLRRRRDPRLRRRRRADAAARRRDRGREPPARLGGRSRRRVRPVSGGTGSRAGRRTRTRSARPRVRAEGDGAGVRFRPPVEVARVDDGRGGPVLRPVLVAVPPLRASRERPLPRRRPSRRVLRPVRCRRDRRSPSWSRCC